MASGGCSSSWFELETSDEVNRKPQGKRRDGFLVRNGALLLEEMIRFGDEEGKPIRMFSEEELKNATNNFAHECMIKNVCDKRIYKGKHGGRGITVGDTWGAGSRIMSDLINEVAVLHRINHPNVVKLVGCCLETEIPLIVYEDLPTETLSSRLCRSGPCACIPWENRLKIVTDIAHALTYMHMATITPIIHMSIKTSNILLGECFAVKIVGFDLSVSMPFGETEIECSVMTGTLGYMDPVYAISGKLSEKCDVFSYGVLLFEVLSGKKPGLLTEFCESTEEKQIISFLDSRVLQEAAKKEQFMPCLRLAQRCVANTWEERPDMKGVTEELWRIRGL